MAGPAPPTLPSRGKASPLQQGRKRSVGLTCPREVGPRRGPTCSSPEPQVLELRSASAWPGSGASPSDAAGTGCLHHVSQPPPTGKLHLPASSGCSRDEGGEGRGVGCPTTGRRGTRLSSHLCPTPKRSKFSAEQERANLTPSPCRLAMLSSASNLLCILFIVLLQETKDDSCLFIKLENTQPTSGIAVLVMILLHPP